MLHDGGGERFSAEHAGDFLHAGRVVELADFGEGASVFNVFGDGVMRAAVRGDLWQVGDAEHLMVFRDLFQFFADRIGDFAADIGVDFVEYQ